MNLQDLNITGKKLENFNKKGIYTLEDLANYLPKKYYDFTKPVQVGDLIDGACQAIIGNVSDVTIKNNAVIVKLRDKNNRSFGVAFFNQNYKFGHIIPGYNYLVCGLVRISAEYYGYASFVNPVIFSTDIQGKAKIYAAYSKIAKTSEQFLQDKINIALRNIDTKDYLEKELIDKYHLIPYYEAKKSIHRPANMLDVQKAKKRLLFDDLFQFNFAIKKNVVVEKSNVCINSFEKTKQFMDSLPFELTEGQRLALRDVTRRMKLGKKVNVLVQGDVGSGKTLIAELLMCVVSENGAQSCLVAPTEILASQHYAEVKAFMEPLGFKIGYLTGKTKKKEQNRVLEDLENGTIDIIVGTHSLMSERVKFKNLGIAIIDEEHRFGVNQKDALKKKGTHIVSMSATPIPRTIAVSMFGNDVVIENVNCLPKGRQPIKTETLDMTAKTKVFHKILEELKKGRQAYIICPLIEKSKNENFAQIANIKEEYEKAKSFFNKHGFTIDYITGDSGEGKQKNVNEVLNDFKNKKIDVLMATTIVEVGVNVPNATIISILNAERFGYSQIHQLRGRVGRGNEQSFCYLLSRNPEKFNIFTTTTDGFKIAQKDLENRGAGTFLGPQQSGVNKYLMLILANQRLNEEINKDIDLIMQDKQRYEKYKKLLKNKTINEN